MSVTQVYIVDELKKKIQLLAEKLEDHQHTSAQLKAENKNLEDKLKNKETEINELKQQNNTLKLTKAFIDENGGAQEAKMQINKIVREIDKCIALLNR